jgi:two-component system response regulator PilR (NtrC family)
MDKVTILIAEDEDLMRDILKGLLEEAGYRVLAAANGQQALELFSTEQVALVITDIRMAGLDGLELLDRLKDIDSEVLVIIITAYSSVESAVAALRKGAYDYIMKPFINEDILQTVKKALTQRALFRENRYLRRELRQKYRFENIIGASNAMADVFRLVERVSGTTTNVLIQGESGTGKELVARAVHYNSPRSDGPFLAINCAAVPENLLESELFGYQRGAFTGATQHKMGLFKAADGGTLLLDEISEMANPLQVRLLRAIQEREILPLGATKPVPFNARLIASTNRDLEEVVKKGDFREDLFYRLSVITINLPPLRERREDIPMLVKHFVSKFSHERGLPEKRVTAEAMKRLVSYHWPGNVRELMNCIEHAIVLGDQEIDVAALPVKVGQAEIVTEDLEGFAVTLDALERQYVLQILDRVGNDKVKAAQILGIDLSTLYRKLKRYGQE